MKRIHAVGFLFLLTFFSVTVAAAQSGVSEFAATLNGSAEVPGPGDMDGSGSAAITINTEKSEVCFTLKFADIGAPTAAHIHEGSEGQSGDPVATLTPISAGDGSETEAKSCVSADAEVLTRIVASPGDFYVNVHNEEFPDGAIRGQLAAKE